MWKCSRLHARRVEVQRSLGHVEAGNQPRGARADARRTLLSRDFSATSTDPDDQRTAFTAKGLPSGAKLWSKAGWTTKVRHDSAYVELPTGEKLVWVILTQGVSSDRAVIPAVSRRFFAWFSRAR